MDDDNTACNDDVAGTNQPTDACRAPPRAKMAVSRTLVSCWRMERLLLSWGAALEDLTRGANIIGWNTVEVCALFSFVFFRSGLLFDSRSSQQHMLIGTLNEHSVFVQETESIFEQTLEFYMSHVHFKLHETT